METEVLSTRKYKVGYVVHTEKITMDDCPDVIMKSAYTPDGAYIGNSVWAHRLFNKYGVVPEVSPHSIRQMDDPNDANGGKGPTCSIGFCEKEEKWYGWSHRAMYGFGIGDTVKDGDCCASSGWTDEYLKMHNDDFVLPVGFEAKTIKDAKRMGIAFASSVG